MSSKTPNSEKRTAREPTPDITGPHPEPTAFGGFTGAFYYRCEGCGGEWLQGEREYHRGNCPNAE